LQHKPSTAALLCIKSDATRQSARSEANPGINEKEAWAERGSAGVPTRAWLIAACARERRAPLPMLSNAPRASHRAERCMSARYPVVPAAVSESLPAGERKDTDTPTPQSRAARERWHRVNNRKRS